LAKAKFTIEVTTEPDLKANYDMTTEEVFEEVEQNLDDLGSDIMGVDEWKVRRG
jgi:hypothetical protein